MENPYSLYAQRKYKQTQDCYSKCLFINSFRTKVLDVYNRPISHGPNKIFYCSKKCSNK